jgi:hypothetical protein
MARNPVAYDGGELSQLQSEPAIRPRRDAEGVFIEPNLGALVAGIEPAIQPRLRERNKFVILSDRRETRSAWIEKVVAAAVD